MRKLIAFALLLSTLPAAAFAGTGGKDSDSKRVICTKVADPRGTLRDRRVECRTVRIVPAIVDPTPLFIL